MQYVTARFEIHANDTTFNYTGVVVYYIDVAVNEVEHSINILTLHSMNML